MKPMPVLYIPHLWYRHTLILICPVDSLCTEYLRFAGVATTSLQMYHSTCPSLPLSPAWPVVHAWQCVSNRRRLQCWVLNMVHWFWVSKTSSPVSLAERDCFLGSNWRIAWLTIVACVAGIDICFSWWSAPFVYVCVSHASLSPIQLLFFHSLIQTISCTQSFTCPFDPTAGSSPMPYVLKKRSLGYISCFYISPLHIFFTLMYICIQCIFLGKFSGWKTGKCVDYVPQLATERAVKVWVRCERALNGSTPHAKRSTYQWLLHKSKWR